MIKEKDLDTEGTICFDTASKLLSSIQIDQNSTFVLHSSDITSRQSAYTKSTRLFIAHIFHVANEV